MPKENDLEGQQDLGGKHGGQQGMPKAADRPRHNQASARDRDRDRAVMKEREPDRDRTTVIKKEHSDGDESKTVIHHDRD